MKEVQWLTRVVIPNSPCRNCAETIEPASGRSNRLSRSFALGRDGISMQQGGRGINGSENFNRA